MNNYLLLIKLKKKKIQKHLTDEIFLIGYLPTIYLNKRENVVKLLAHDSVNVCLMSVPCRPEHMSSPVQL